MCQVIDNSHKKEITHSNAIYRQDFFFPTTTKTKIITKFSDISQNIYVYFVIAFNYEQLIITPKKLIKTFFFFKKVIKTTLKIVCLCSVL